MESATAPPTPAADALRSTREKLIVALDFPTVGAARRLVDALGDSVGFYKVGLGLQLEGGDRFAIELKERGKRVFLDYKYFDIDETIRNAVAKAAAFGIDFLTVHGAGGVLRAAVAGRGASNLKILCVTVLTSMDAEDIREMGFDCDVEALVLARARKALDTGCDGVIASAQEAHAIRQTHGDRLMVVSPGIRPSGSATGDQKRAATPGGAIRAGADYLVVGRPITQAADPAAAAAAIIAEMAAALG